jgi:hypothetical protein
MLLLTETLANYSIANEIATLYEVAVSKNPKNEKLQVGLFNSYVRLQNFQKQNQVQFLKIIYLTVIEGCYEYVETISQRNVPDVGNNESCTSSWIRSQQVT